jgi:hypothetical protein
MIADSKIYGTVGLDKEVTEMLKRQVQNAVI